MTPARRRHEATIGPNVTLKLDGDDVVCLFHGREVYRAKLPEGSRLDGAVLDRLKAIAKAAVESVKGANN